MCGFTVGCDTNTNCIFAAAVSLAGLNRILLLPFLCWLNLAVTSDNAVPDDEMAVGIFALGSSVINFNAIPAIIEWDCMTGNKLFYGL